MLPRLVVLSIPESGVGVEARSRRYLELEPLRRASFRWAVTRRSPELSWRSPPFRSFSCGWCGQRVFICRPCDRGQKYCSPSCSRQSRLSSQRKASQCYQSTATGKANHAARSARYRRRQLADLEVVPIGVTQQGLAPVKKTPDPSLRLCFRCCAVCAAPWSGAKFRRFVWRLRRSTPWKTRRRRRRAF